MWTPPDPIGPLAPRSVFLAGTIDMDRGVSWQQDVIAALGDLEGDVLNPRRDSWDESWVPSADDPQFRIQVQWELDGLERAGLVAMYLAPGSRSPISLLELGLLARSGRMLVCCPDGFWRKGNVDMVCEHFAIDRVDDLGALIDAIRAYLRGG